MKCKYCGNNVPDGSVFCNHCGERLVRAKAKKEISVPKPRQLKNGDWYAQMMVKGRTEYVTAATEKEYYARARAIKSGMLEQARTGPKILTSAMVDNYIAANRNVLSPSTLRGYSTYRNNRFQPEMNKEAAAVDWQAAINRELREVSPKTVNNAWRLITASMKYAGLAVPSVNLPKVPKADRPWLDNEQIKIFLEAVKGQPCELAALLALHSLRRSEILGLSRDKVKDGVISVRGAAVLDDENRLVKKATNKNASSARDIPVMISRLLELVSEMDTLLAVNPNSLWRQINKVCRDAGLPEVGVHGLRHSFASLAYYLGWSELQTMSVGGWSDFNTVHKIYTHLAEKQRTADVEKMADFYSES